MYQSIFELPTQVLGSLNEEDCLKWMQAYNSLRPKDDVDVRKAKRAAWHAVESAPSSFSFKAIASTDTIDKAKDIIDLDTVKEHMDALIDRGGNIQNDHHNYTVGTIWDWAPCTIMVGPRKVDAITVWGNLFGGNTKGDVYNNTRKAFVDGMNSLSIAGNAAKGKYECDERGCYTRRMVDQLMEVSITTNPMNTYCTLQWYNESAPIAKSASALNLGLVEYEIHKDETTCPYLSLKRSLVDAGFTEVHAREDGVHVPFTPLSYVNSRSYFQKAGLVGRYDGADMILNERSHYIEKSFKDCLKAGYIDEDGYFTRSIPEDKFKEFAECDVITEDDRGFRFVRSTLDDFDLLEFEEPEPEPEPEMTEDELEMAALQDKWEAERLDFEERMREEEERKRREQPPPAAATVSNNNSKKASDAEYVKRNKQRLTHYLDALPENHYIRDKVGYHTIANCETPEDIKRLQKMIDDMKANMYRRGFLIHGGRPAPPGWRGEGNF